MGSNPIMVTKFMIINSESEYEESLAEIERLMDAENRADGKGIDSDRLDALVTAVEAYEAKHYKL